MSRHVIEVMGTVVSLDFRDGDPAPELLEAVERDLRWVDQVFSTYRPHSEISRLAAGSLRLADCVPEVREVLDLCAELSRRTDGWFSATAGGRLDPTGVVKGWAVARVADLLSGGGHATFAVNGGGDVQTAGAPADGVWRVGVADPHRPGQLAVVVGVRGLAVATSGTAERGAHIVNPFTGAPATEIAGVTVIGPGIVDADAFATAACAMGRAARGWLARLDGHEALLIGADGVRWSTDGFDRFVVSSDVGGTS